MPLQGFVFPRNATGNASLVPETPWHYSGTMLTLEYLTNPDRVAELLPDYLEVADENPGGVAIIWAEWQNCRDDYSEILDPARSQYKEAFVVVRCKFQGKTYSRCVYIWVDADYAMVRGHHQGYPKKLASIFVTRPITVGQAGPRLEPGGRFGASVAAYDHKLIHATFQISGESDHAGFVNSHPMLHNRWMAAIEGNGDDSLDELVTMSAYQAELGRCFRGEFEMQLFDSPVEDLIKLQPIENLAGYWREIGFSWRSGTTLRRRNLPEIE